MKKYTMRSYTATNLREVQQARDELAKYVKELKNFPEVILQKEAKRTQSEAYNETPYKTGRLRRSVKAVVTRSARRPGMSLQASAKDPTTGKDYSVDQHENTSYRHTVGKSHYLRDPFRRAVKRLVTQFKRRAKLE